MKQINCNCNSFLLSLLLFFFCSSLFSQQNRLPSKQELETKMALLELYRSSSNSSSKTGVPSHIMVTGPEQDCDNAIPVCSQSYTQTSSYTGHGTIQEVNGTCLSTQETNSVWYVFTVQNSGTFTFLLNTTNDYDYALYDITTIGCSGVPSAIPIRCNFSATYGSTGLTLPSAAGNLSYNASQVPTMPGINVTAGQTFVLIVDNYSANSNGYTLTFGGTAQIFDNIPPTITTSNFPCNGSLVNVNFSEPVSCSSISANGSDFTITGPLGNVPVISASGNLCSTGASNTNFASVNFNNSGLTTGIYTVNVVVGTDGNTLLDKCGNVMSAANSFTFAYLAPITVSASSPSICAGSSSTLTILGASGASGISYVWSPITAPTSSVVVDPSVNTTYVVTASYGGCSNSASTPITITLPPVVSVNPANVSLCSGTTNILASATSGGSPCLNCTYNWSGSSTQTNLAVPSSTIVGAGAGSYSVTVVSNDGCVGNTAVSIVSILSPAASPACNIIYASPAGGGTGLIPSSPTDIQTALTLGACNSVVIKMQIGDYIINNPLITGGFTTIEGGYNVGYTLKTSATATTGGFPLQGTRIIRSATNLEGSAGNFRYTALSVGAASSNFKIQDIRIEMPDNASGTAISNYGIYLNTGCSNYDITRCYIYSGNAGSGANGTAITTPTGTAGGNGANGSAGDIDDQEDAGSGGGGGGGGGSTAGLNGSNGSGNFNSANNCSTVGGAFGTAGSTGGNGGTGASDPDACGCCNNGGGGNAGAISINSQSGGGGGGGGSGGSESRVGGAGGAGGGVFSHLGANNTGGTGGSGGDPGGSGSVGSAGTNGAIGSTGTVGSAGSDATGFWAVGGQGSTGANGFGGQGGRAGGGGGGQGCTFCIDGAGSGGGGGGGGGQGGYGGNGGFSGGSTFGIFIFSNGVNGNIVDCQIINGSFGAGGTGGSGSVGGSGGNGGLGSPYNLGEVGAGGNGGRGGNGGQGGTGGAGSAGIANPVRVVGGSGLTSNISTFTLSTQPVIVVENKACSNVNIAHTTSLGSPVWSSFGISAAPASGSGSPVNTSYSTLGRKTVVMNTSNYTDFNNIIVSAPSTGSIVASATSICPGFVNFASTAVGTAGLNYTWSVLPAGATISSASTSTTSVLFPNAVSTSITYTITLSITTNCCGALAPVTTTVVVNPIPVAPSAIVNSICIGGIATYSATAPAGSSFNWYNAASSGTLLASGNTYSVANVLTPITVYLQATNSSGCSSTLTPVVVTPTAVPPPTGIPGSACDIGMVQVGINPVTGITNYNWYSDAGGTTLVQSGNSLNYSQNIATAGGTYIVYVQSNIAGCAPSGLVPITASVSTTPITLAQTILPNDTVCINTPVSISLNPSGGNGSYTYTWSPITSNLSSISQTVSLSTSYNVFVSSNGCSKLFYLPIIVNPLPKDTIGTPLAISCTNSLVTLDGSFSASGAGISYSWTTSGGIIVSSAINNTVSVSTGGTYSLLVTDGVTGCSSTQSVSVTGSSSLPTLTISASSNTLTCATPTIQLTASSSTGGVTYSWTTIGGALTSATIANPIATSSGTYIVVVTNTATSCQSTQTINIVPDTSIPTVSVSANSLTITCTNTTVTTALTSTNTISSYSWSPIPSVGGANPVFNTSGLYNATITASNGCSITTAVNVTTDNLAPNVSLTSAVNSGTITCFSPSVNISPTITPNSSNLTYTWSPSNVSSSTLSAATFTVAGIYTLAITNTLTGCVTSLTNTANTFTVIANNAPPTFTLGTLPSLTTTCSSPTVALSASSNAGVNGVYTWLTPVPSTLTGNPINASAAGIYTVYITDTNSGCSSASAGQNTVEIVADAGIPTVLLTANSLSITCSNTQPTLTLTTSAPTNSVTYAWTPTVGIIPGTETTASPSFSAIGNYSVVVTNTGTGCASSISLNTVTVSLNNTIPTTTLSLAANDGTLTCLTTSISLTPVISPLSPDLTYTWSPSAGIFGSANQANVTFTASGIYTLAITNTLTGCASVLTNTANIFSVQQTINTPTITLTSTGGNTGTLTCLTISIVVTPTVIPANSTYTWTSSTGTFTNTIDAIFTAPDSYTLTVTDAVTGCTTSATNPANVFTVYQTIVTPTITLTNAGVNTDTLTCLTTSIVVTPTVIPAGSTYTWTSGLSGVIANSSSISITSPDSYTLTVTEAVSGCTTSATNPANVFTVYQNTVVPTATLSSVGANSGIITCTNTSVSITPVVLSTANLTYTWSPSGVISSSINDATFTSQGVYTLAITNTLTGCVNSLTNTANIYTVTDIRTPITASISPTSTNVIIGCGASNSSVTLQGGSNAITPSYTWMPGGINTQTVAAIASGDYTLSVVDATNGCTSFTTITVIGSTTTPQGVDAGASANIACGSATVNLNGVTTTPNTSFSWSGPSATSIISGSNTANPIVTEVGDYTLTVTDNLTGCSSSAIVNVTQAIATATITANPTSGISPLDVAFTGSSAGNPSYNWNFGDGSTSTNQNPNNVFNAGTYTVVLTTTSGTCVATATVEILVEDGFTLEIPNVFTPNDDKSNDIFKIKSTGVKEISLQIFNRWGQKLYEFSGPKASWDGITPNGVKVPEGTYFYFVKATGFDGQEIEKHGTVNLFR